MLKFLVSVRTTCQNEQEQRLLAPHLKPLCFIIAHMSARVYINAIWMGQLAYYTELKSHMVTIFAGSNMLIYPDTITWEIVAERFLVVNKNTMGEVFVTLRRSMPPRLSTPSFGEWSWAKQGGRRFRGQKLWERWTIGERSGIWHLPA